MLAICCSVSAFTASQVSSVALESPSSPRIWPNEKPSSSERRMNGCQRSQGALSKLGPLEPAFLAVSAVCIGVGFWRVYGGRAPSCAGPACGTSRSRRMTEAVLWLALLLLAISSSVGWWGQFLA